MKCPNCGQELSDQARFCRFCGQRLKQEAVPQPSQQPMKTEPEIVPRRQPTATDTRNKTSLWQKKVVWVLIALTLLLVVVLGVVLLLAGKSDSASRTAEEMVTSEESSHEEEQPAQSAASSVIPTEWGQQEILVTPSGGGTAVLTLRQKYGDSWRTLYTCAAVIGRNGTTSTPREGDGKTPEGTFPVEFCYGLEQPETGIPFVQVEPDSIWVDDRNSPYYNCLTTQAEAGNVSHEDTYPQFARGFYTVNLFFANNGDGRTPGVATPGAGSVRVLEGYTKSLEPTNGDIKITSEDMEQLLQRLDIDYAPVVTVVSGP